ncbi:dienelactone hydrolase [Legionella santicrucis]|uniref:Dienelactone hydrolase n=1 Tax=Legionella santicrucis TaxID=45074 RepID=A0A0W0YVI0_9GAMM|nr:hypothetical protein [Legionella santicrucis]KTD60890.1 dienelactone hydrolase [Legionella santicrucis]
MRCEFQTYDVDGTMATMAENAHLLNVPVITGGVGLAEIRKFYQNSFIPQLPEDTETTLISRTIGEIQIVDELIFKFTHTIQMDWILPGLSPTNKRVEIALVVIIGFNGYKVSHEHIYWDQASVLVQLGLLDTRSLPITGIESSKMVANPHLYSMNGLHLKNA